LETHFSDEVDSTWTHESFYLQKFEKLEARKDSTNQATIALAISSRKFIIEKED